VSVFVSWRALGRNVATPPNTAVMRGKEHLFSLFLFHFFSLHTLFFFWGRFHQTNKKKKGANVSNPKTATPVVLHFSSLICATLPTQTERRHETSRTP
jgi:hypothetical protein